MPDLELAIRSMKDSPKWVYNIFERRDPTRANDQNESIATHILSKVFLARWIVLKTFIRVVMEYNQGTLPSNIQHDWLLFQLRPTDSRNTFMINDPFTHIILQLSGASQGRLATLTAQYSSEVAGLIKFKSFFCVIDEAQVAGEAYMGAFSSSDGENKRPVLRPLAGFFQKYQSIKLILSGTGFSLSLFRERMGANVSKATIPLLVDYFSGGFFDRNDQLSYVARYLPRTYLDSASGKHLETRIRRWLRGRCVATKC